MKMKIWILLATAFLVVGLALFCVVMSVYGWDFGKIGGIYETNTHSITREFHSITTNTDTANITYIKSTDGSCKVVCHEPKNTRHCATVEDGVLNIRVSDERKWYEKLLNFGSPKITVYLPEQEYRALTVREATGNVEISRELQFQSLDVSVSTGNVDCYASVTGALKLKASTGQLQVSNLSAGSVDLSVSTGNVRVTSVKCEGDIRLKVSTGAAVFTDVSCRNLNSEGSTGNFTLQNVIAEEKLSIRRSTGNIRFDQCDGGEISVSTSTGNVTGSFLTEKIVYAHTSTGKVEVPKSTSGGLCEIRTSTGNVKITICS